MNIFLAGASGVIGRRLVPLLRDAGHAVTGTARSQEKAAALDVLGAKGVVVDAFDARALLRAMYAAHPDVVIHQLTDLPDALPDLAHRDKALEKNARLRVEGTRNLMAAAAMAGARRVVAQSIAFVYAPGAEPHGESDPLTAEKSQRATVKGVVALERAVLNTHGIDGLVLRYGRLYGPGTWYVRAEGPAPLHVDAAAHAALLAVTRGAPGVYNIVEDDGFAAIDKARRELGFAPGFRIT
jgi:nucleoside-diphosphate-sugar epimerase